MYYKIINTTFYKVCKAKQYYNMNVVKLSQLLTFCRMFKKTVTNESLLSHEQTMFIQVTHWKPNTQKQVNAHSCHWEPSIF